MNYLNTPIPTKCNYNTADETDDYITLRDLGPHDRFQTITNAAEWVVEQMVPRLKGRKLYYIDTDGNTDQLLIHAGKFAGFIAGGPDDGR